MRSTGKQRGGIPPELRLTASEVVEIFFGVTDYRSIFYSIARAYTNAFDRVVSEELGIPLKLEFDDMDSPREYNFSTDRIFCMVPLSAVEALMRRSAEEGHKRLADCIEDRFTSRSGFSSYYSNDLADWLEKPLEIWDHNELGTLLRALMDDPEDRDLSVYYAVCDGDGCYSEWSNGVDWTAFEREVAELREAKVAELQRG
jgi:hypothetical protein